MRPNIILRYIGLVLLLNAVFMFLSAMISLFNGIDSAFKPLMMSTLFTTILGVYPLIFVRSSSQLNNKEGFAVVVLAWLASCFAGMLPYMMWGGEFSLINSWFESVSGFTTTGNTILSNVEALPKGLLFWRSSTHWIGGMGVVMFVLLVLPSFGKLKMTLSSVEMSTLAKDNYKYRTHNVIQILLFVYIGLTVSLAVLLRIAGMDWFDSVNHAFSTIATGGFSTKNQSIAFYNNIGIEVILIAAMTLASMHFGLIFATLTGKRKNLFTSEVSRIYMIVLLAACLLVGVNLWLSDIYPTFLSSLRFGSFQVASVMSTSGLATADSSLWPPFAVLALIYCTIQCGCAGSTAGGLKMDRVILLFKTIKSRILLQQHPNAIVRIRLNNVYQDDAVVHNAVLYIAIYLVSLLLGSLLIAFTGEDLMTSFSACAACIGNVGPGFGKVYSLGNYGELSMFVKVVLTFLMLLGRLEIFGFLQLFIMKSWR